MSKTVDDAVAMTTTTTVYVHSGQQILAEYPTGASTSSPDKKYVYGTYVDELLALIDRTAAGATGAGSDEILYAHQSHQYHVIALTDTSGNVFERYAYTPYGEVTILNPAATSTRATSDIGNPVTYTGRWLDPETQLYHFRARMLHPRLGRFIGRDALSYIDGVHLYRAYFAPSTIDPQGTQLIVPQPPGITPWDDISDWTIDDFFFHYFNGLDDVDIADIGLLDDYLGDSDVQDAIASFRDTLMSTALDQSLECEGITSIVFPYKGKYRPDLTDTIFALGNNELDATAVCTVWLEDCRSCCETSGDEMPGKVALSCKMSFSFTDEFGDPWDIANRWKEPWDPVGTPYDISGSFKDTFYEETELDHPCDRPFDPLGLEGPYPAFY